MKTYMNETIEIKGITEEKYEMLIDFLNDNKIDYEETEIEDYTIDNRTEAEKYDDWLWTLADMKNEDRKLGIE